MSVANTKRAFWVPTDPPVSLANKFSFYVWVVMIGFAQLWRDLKTWTWYRPLHFQDIANHYFYIPIGREDVRILLSAPNDRVFMKTIPKAISQDYNVKKMLSYPEREIVNAGSNNYGGFTRFEYSSASVIKLALQHLPFNPAPPELRMLVEKELADYMNAKACATAISGYGANLLAFLTFAETAKELGRQCIFLLDAESHSSMFVGAFLNKQATFHRFKHNDVADLEFKLRTLRENNSNAMVCVAVEGMYSLAGNVAPVPTILALRKIFGFCLLVDEAHSFMALGRGGRGSFEWWQARGYECPLDEVDIMTATFSKSVGCTGGFVVSNGIYATVLQKQSSLQHETGDETLSTIVLLRALTLIRKPEFIESRMSTLEKKSRYVADRLRESGCIVLSPPGSPIICFPVGTIEKASKFHAELLQRGFAIACGVPPATPIWSCRIRVCIFATTSWSDILGLVNALIAVSCLLKIDGVRPMGFDIGSLPSDGLNEKITAGENHVVDSALQKYVLDLAEKYPANESKTMAPLTMSQARDVSEAGLQSFDKYGIGASSVRWFYGTFDVFIKLEDRLASLYPSLVAFSGNCRAMLGSDANVMAISLLSATTAPLYAKDVLNVVLVPQTASSSVRRGATLNKVQSSTRVIIYDDMKNLAVQVRDLHKTQAFHLTLYQETVSRDGYLLDLSNSIKLILSAFQDISSLKGLTLILDDSRGLGKVGPRHLGFLDEMESQHGTTFFSKALGPQLAAVTTVVVFGSWFESFHHQGGYVISSQMFTDSHTVSSKSFVFSTPPMIVQAAMSDKVLELLSQTDPV
ncbi:pyridoxal phosphate-dependent transferase [Bipolaris maydis]|uniref:pyridoxal phosphate-dependent transferase n=1 Tax=Cochliobolus heterostrophus TaxID=5016 RepID=UPI000321232D|nr:pyridoxal phosphate-dependent transferase [Bipolaris maydis]KAJ6193810.1 pyridoxal phosphate-dependent transferase [Bipolaris maydis]KAJ6267016.1 pyridoxal phosphate-dependent transferase [Bipolaris maydis]KAJ6277634.1 pyridoxal phosphate-dependent transferase [Bipolaris maydis]